MTPAMQFRNVTVEFGRRGFGRRPFRALDGLTLTVAAGDFLALIGPNGSGKTTAIHCALGLRQPTAGTADVFGHRLVFRSGANPIMHLKSPVAPDRQRRTLDLLQKI